MLRLDTQSALQPSTSVGMLPLAGWVLAAVTAALALHGLRWGIVHDASLMFYIGREVASGARSIVDIFDMNMPLVYWVHAGIYLLIGTSGPAWHVVDLAMMAVVCSAGYRLVAPISAPYAALAALAMLTQHLYNGAYLTGQRDIFMLMWALLSAAALARAAEREDFGWGMLRAGVLLGLAINAKPAGAVYAPFLLGAVALAMMQHGTWRSRLPQLALAAASFAAGSAMPCAILVLVLHLQGVLPDFIEAWREYLLPVYGSVRHPLLWVLPYVWMPFVVLATLFGLACAAGATWRPSVRLWMLLAVVFGSLAEYLVQGKGWLYQAAPASYTAMLLGGVILAGLARAGAEGRRLADLTVVSIIGLGSIFAAAELVAPDSKGPEDAFYVKQLAADIDRLVEPGLPVQALDNADGALAALLHNGRRQPTRFIYDFQFFIGPPTAYRARLRAEFLASLAAAGPHALVVTNRQWPEVQGFERLDGPGQWPELNSRLGSGYRLVLARSDGFAENRAYRIYRSIP